MEKEELLNRKAHLESINDQLFSELMYLDHLMKKVGFSDGLETVKATAEELISMEKEIDEGDDLAA